MYYTYACWQFEYTPHCAIMRTLLLTQSVLVLTRSAGVRINVIIIWFVHTLLVCASVRFTEPWHDPFLERGERMKIHKIWSESDKYRVSYTSRNSVSFVRWPAIWLQVDVSWRQGWESRNETKQPSSYGEAVNGKNSDYIGKIPHLAETFITSSSLKLSQNSSKRMSFDRPWCGLQERSHLAALASTPLLH